MNTLFHASSQLTPQFARLCGFKHLSLQNIQSKLVKSLRSLYPHLVFPEKMKRVQRHFTGSAFNIFHRLVSKHLSIQYAQSRLVKSLRSLCTHLVCPKEKKSLKWIQHRPRTGNVHKSSIFILHN